MVGMKAKTLLAIGYGMGHSYGFSMPHIPEPRVRFESEDEQTYKQRKAEEKRARKQQRNLREKKCQMRK